MNSGIAVLVMAGIIVLIALFFLGMFVAVSQSPAPVSGYCEYCQSRVPAGKERSIRVVPINPINQPRIYCDAFCRRHGEGGW